MSPVPGRQRVQAPNAADARQRPAVRHLPRRARLGGRNLLRLTTRAVLLSLDRPLLGTYKVLSSDEGLRCPARRGLQHLHELLLPELREERRCMTGGLLTPRDKQDPAVVYALDLAVEDPELRGVALIVR
jgi:hypothetical protein